VYDLAESVINSWKGSIAKHLCELSGCCNLEEDLNLVQRLAVRRIADSQTVEAKSGVFVLICSNIHVAVVVVIEWQIPVSVTS